MDLVTYGGPDSRCGEWVGNRDGVLGTPALIRSIARGIVKPCRVPEQCVNSTSAQYQSNGRRAGLKIRSSQERVWVEVPPSVLSARRESAGRSLRLGRPYHPPFECDPRLLNRNVVKHRAHQFGGRMEPSTRSSGRLPAPCGPWV